MTDLNTSSNLFDCPRCDCEDFVDCGVTMPVWGLVCMECEMELNEEAMELAEENDFFYQIDEYNERQMDMLNTWQEEW